MAALSLHNNRYGIPVNPRGIPRTDSPVIEANADMRVLTNMNFFQMKEADHLNPKIVIVDGERGVIYTYMNNPQAQNDSSNLFYFADTTHNGIEYKFSMFALTKKTLIKNEPLLEQIFSTLKFLP